MSSFKEALAGLRDNLSPAKYGLAFEKLMVNYLQADPTFSQEFSEVYRWDDWPYNGGKRDTGIDLVARRTEDNTWTAIQCKFYKESTSMSKGHLDSFFEASGRTFTTDTGIESFASRLIISTTDHWSSNAEAMLENQLLPTSRIGLAEISQSPIDWDIVYPGSQMQVHLSRKKTYEPRPHQAEAIEKTITGFATHDRGKLIMACGTGKTFTALRLAERFAEENGGRARILFLVPSISLLSQTLKEWTAQARLDLKFYAVCSDSKVSKKAEDIASYDLEVPVSTNGAAIAERMAHGKRASGLQVVFSTYQSLPAVHDAQELGLDAFDLAICDEAHRTTGVTLAGEDASNFVKIHDPAYIKATKRLYMTATPRLFDETVKGKAAEHSAEVASMDDESTYGPEFYRLGFGEAVDKGLLTDYKVLVMTVDESVAADAMARGDGQAVNLTLASAMIGAWNALAKRSGKEQGTSHGFDIGARAMQRTVAFAQDIKTSTTIAETYPALIHQYQELLAEAAVMNDISQQNIGLEIACQHVDGSMNAMQRNSKLSWLQASIPEDETRILTNARCLSEGVDVPALDAVIFFNPRNSMVDVVQSVGRVMRKSEGKDYGYIILPVAVPPGKSPSEALNDNARFKVVWQILNALRAHDDRFNAKVNSIALNEASAKELPIEVDPVTNPRTALDEQEKEAAREQGTDRDRNLADDAEAAATQMVLFSMEQWQEAMYVKIVDKVGTRTYWEDWADDVATIAEAQITRIHALLDNANPKIQREFKAFVKGLRGNLNESITDDDAINMLSQHLITAPVFNALFAEHDFASHNPVAQVMQRMVEALSDSQLESETESLERFYQSVRVRASEVTSAAGKQQVVKDLYERFFRKAFKKQSEALGIVYTPVEIVDFIIRAADDLSTKHFGKGLSDEGVYVLDPFTGTGTFIVRLLQSGRIKPEDLARKYAGELFATEIMLLAYYVAAVNIEATYNTLIAAEANSEGEETPDYVPFTGIALADTFQVHEDGDAIDYEIFKDNNAAIEKQKAAPIHVILGNPPYSVGQRSANDLNANLKYPTLDKRIEETYAAKSSATSKIKLYDSYLRAFRWATDRIGDHGIVAFVSNGGWIDGNSSDGVRLSLAEDFTDIYVYNLRGNQRTSGELSRKEGGKVFGSGSRATVAITIGVKDTAHSDGECRIHYHQVGDYLSAEEKLAIVDKAHISTIEWKEIQPNQYGDWINQRSDDFGTWPVLGDKKNERAIAFFSTYSLGLSTAKDSWCYGSSHAQVSSHIGRLITTYESARSVFQDWIVTNGVTSPKKSDVDRFLSDYPDFVNPKSISWGTNLKSHLSRDLRVEYFEKGLTHALYRPFIRQVTYFDQLLNERRYQLPVMFPTPEHDNTGFYVVNPGSAKPFSAIATTLIPDLAMWGSNAGQFFSRWTWEPLEAPEGELDIFGVGVASGRKDNTETSNNASGTAEASAQASGLTSAPNSGKTVTVGQAGALPDPIGDAYEGEVRGGYRRVDNVTDQILGIYQDALGADVTKDDIFYFVYGQLHDPAYREKYAADLKKMLPHIETPTSRARFDQLARAGRELMALHVGYEDVEPYPLTVEVKGSADDRETWRVQKMKWAKKTDPESGKKVNDTTTLIYNKKVTIRDIPAEAELYMLGSRSALAWIIDRYQVKKDKASGIINDPNDWADEVGNPRYIAELIGKVTRVAVETVRIVDGLEDAGV